MCLTDGAFYSMTDDAAPVDPDAILMAPGAVQDGDEGLSMALAAEGVTSFVALEHSVLGTFNQHH